MQVSATMQPPRPANKKFRVQCVNQDKGKAVMDVCSAGCIGCTLCVKTCEHEAISMNGNVAHIDYEKCVACGACADKCPKRIIRMFGISTEP